jgi:hypothetical protein
MQKEVYTVEPLVTGPSRLEVAEVVKAVGQVVIKFWQN